MSIDYSNSEKENAHNIRAAVYIRFSSHKQIGSFSVDYQKEECLKYIENKGYRFTKFYIDEAKTGKKTAGREALEQMLVEAGRNKFDRIVVYSFSRSFRNTRDALNYNHELMEKYDINIESVIEPVDMRSPHGKYGATNLFAMHELQSNVTAAHVKSGMNVGAQNGYYLGGYVPLGYELYETGEIARGKPKKKYRVNEAEAVIIKDIYEMYSAYYSLNYIQQEMKKRNVYGRKGKIISLQTIYNILRNPFYIGIRDYKIKGYERIYLENAVPIIIERRLWNAVQERHREYKENHPVIPRKTKRLYALTGKLVCAKCGAHLTGVYKGNKRKENWSYAYYHCTNKKGRNTCDLLNIRKDFIEKYCLDQIKKHILNPEKITEIAAEIVAQNKNQPLQISSEKKQLEKRKAELNAFIKEANKKEIEAKAKKDRIEIESVQDIILDYKAELTHIYEVLERLQDIEETTVTEESVEKFLYGLLKDADNSDPQIIKALFDKLIEKVEIHDDKVILYLIVFPFIPYRDNFPNGQPQFTLVTDIEKDKMRY